MFNIRNQILYFLSRSLFNRALLPILFLALAACSDNNSDSQQKTQASQNHVSGNAVKGVITNGIVSAYLVEPNKANVSNTERSLLGQTRTNSAGEYEISIPSFENDPIVVLELTADSQTTMRCDLVDGCLYPDNINTSNILLAEFGAELPVPSHFKLLGYKQGKNQQNAFISPLSHIIYVTASSLPNGLSSSNLETVSEWVTQAFYLEADILTTKTPDLTKLSDLNDLTDQQLKQGILSSAFYSLTMSEAWSNEEINLNTLPLEEIFRDAAYSAESLYQQLSAEQNGYSEALFAINEATQAIVQTFESKQLIITQQPNSLTINEAQSFSLHVQASGDGDLSYQWTKDNLSIPEANSANYSVVSANLNDAGSYSVTVADSGNLLTSLNALVSVNKVVDPISITKQPQALSLIAGDPINLSVGVTGDGPFEYQWKKDNQDIYGANSVNYSVVSANLSDAGNYNVTITSNGQSLTSLSALISVSPAIEPISIVQQPQPLNLSVGTPFILSVGVTGTGPFDFQWKKDGQDISGANSASYSVTSANLSDAGSYNVTITNDGQSLTSLNALISVSPTVESISITQQPQSLSLIAGAPITLSVGVTGTGPFEFQWKKDGQDISGANSASYNVTSANLSDSGSYNVTITNDGQSLTSLNALISVSSTVESISITQQPQSLSLIAGAPITLSVGITGTGPFEFQWKKDSQNISGANSASYNVTSANLSDAGSYNVTITSSGQSLTSLSALISVSPSVEPVSITQQPQALTLTAGDPITLSVGVTGDGPYNYQWQKAGSILPGETNSTLNITESTQTDSGTYRVTVSNSISETSSEFVSVIVNDSIAAVTINQQPQNLIVTEGETANFQISATGGGFISYQWRKNNVNIADAYTNQLEINPTDMESAGNYDVIVTNSRGSITSDIATLTILSYETPVSITLQPTSKSVFLSDNINLRTAASGDGTLSYQWFFNGQTIIDANQAEYSINNAGPEHQGSYTVVVNNASSSEESLAAFISVIAKPSVQLSWDIPSFREDGNPLEVYEINAYILEYGYSLSAITGQISLTDASTTQYTLTDLESGVLYVHIATIDSSNVQGQFSDWISITIE